MATIQIYEILDLVKKAPDAEEVLHILRKYNSWALRTVLIGTFNPSVKFYRNDAPAGYKPNNVPVQMGFTNLYRDLTKVVTFIDGSNKISTKRLDELLLQFLESLEAREADVIIKMMNKDLEIPILNKEICIEAFGNIM